MASTAKGRVRVRGTCTAGHTTEAQSNPGRVTWEGPCTAEGCELTVKARRVPVDTPAPPPQTATATDGDEDPHRVIEVKGYGTRGKRDDHAGDAGPAPAAEGAGVPAAGSAGDPAGAPEPASEPSGEPSGRQPTGQLTWRQRRAARRVDRPERRRPDFLQGIIG